MRFAGASRQAVAMDRTPLLWTVVLFFGSWLLFAGVHQLTRHQSTAVAVGAQIATLAIVVAALVLFVRRRRER